MLEIAKIQSLIVKCLDKRPANALLNRINEEQP